MMRKLKGVFVFLVIAGMFVFTGQAYLHASGGGYVPWGEIPINDAPRYWKQYNEGELTILFSRFDVGAVYAGSDPCPGGLVVTKMTFSLKLKVAGIQQAFSQSRDVVICDDDYPTQWIELQNFINEVVITSITGSPGVWGPPGEGGNWVITKLAKPAALTDVFMAEINIAVKRW
jgi:hypothetical protein